MEDSGELSRLTPSKVFGTSGKNVNSFCHLPSLRGPTSPVPLPVGPLARPADNSEAGLGLVTLLHSKSPQLYHGVDVDIVKD